MIVKYLHLNSNDSNCRGFCLSDIEKHVSHTTIYLRKLHASFVLKKNEMIFVKAYIVNLSEAKRVGMR